MCDDVHTGRIEPYEERLAVFAGFVHELYGIVEYFVVHGFHAFGTELTRVLYLLLAYFPPSRLHGRVVRAGSPAMDHVPGPTLSLSCCG